jgi:hypothetical protein
MNAPTIVPAASSFGFFRRVRADSGSRCQVGVALSKTSSTLADSCAMSRRREFSRSRRASVSPGSTNLSRARSARLSSIRTSSGLVHSAVDPPAEPVRTMIGQSADSDVP